MNVNNKLNITYFKVGKINLHYPQQLKIFKDLFVKVEFN